MGAENLGLGWELRNHSFIPFCPFEGEPEPPWTGLGVRVSIPTPHELRITLKER